jgi:hypothetical protein
VEDLMTLTGDQPPVVVWDGAGYRIDWPDGTHPAQRPPRRADTQLHQQLDAVRAMLADALPYAHAGAEALGFREPYGPDDDAVREALCEGAGEWLSKRLPVLMREAGIA